MKVVLLCAGYGTRLYPLTENQPKALLPLGGEPLLTHIVRKVEPLPAVERIIVISNGRFYPAFCVWARTLSTGRKLIVQNDKTFDPDHRLGAIRDLKLALEKDGSGSDVLVVAGDNFFDSGLLEFVSFAQAKKKAVTVGTYDVGDLSLAQKYGLIKTDSCGKITAFFEKPKEPETTHASMGIYYFPKDTLPYVDRYLETNRNPDAPGYYVAWLAKEIDVFAFPFRGIWFDIGDLESYAKADEYVRRLSERGTLRK